MSDDTTAAIFEQYLLSIGMAEEDAKAAAADLTQLSEDMAATDNLTLEQKIELLRSA